MTAAVAGAPVKAGTAAARISEGDRVSVHYEMAGDEYIQSGLFLEESDEHVTVALFGGGRTIRRFERSRVLFIEKGA